MKIAFQWLSVLGPAVLGTLVAASASAATDSTCSTDEDCDHGFSCKVVGGSGCTEPACAPDTDCPAPEPCEVVEFRQCVLASCETDSDCASGMVCFAYEVSECWSDEVPPEVPECDPADANCTPAEPPSLPPNDCTVTTEHQCVPRYLLPCEVASDCGEGFECVEVEICETDGGAQTDPGAPEEPGTGGASGSGFSGGTPDDSPPPDADAAPPGTGGTPDGGEKPPESDPGFVPPSDPPDIECKPSGEMRCQVVERECGSAEDCPEGWSCETEDRPPCAPAPDGGDPNCGSTAPPAYCMPPYFDGVDLPESGGSDEGSGSEPPEGGGTTDPIDPEAPAPGTGGDPDSRPVTDPLPPATGGASGNPAGRPGENGDDDASSSASEDDGSCAVANGHASPRQGLGLATLAWLALIGRRRRRSSGLG